MLELGLVAVADPFPFGSFSIITQPPSSYIIPNSSTGAEGLNDEAAGFIKVTLPASIDSEHREAFESILWGLTSFSTGAVPTTTGATPPSYADPSLRSKLVLVDDHGAVLGSLPSSAIAEDPSLSAEGQGEHEKEPVIIEPTTSAPGSTSHFDFTARPLSEWTPTPNPTSSRIIDAGDWISRGVVVGAEVLGRAFEAGADKWVASRPATEKPMVFSPSTSKSVATGESTRTRMDDCWS